MRFRAVLDTNVVVSALLFEEGRLAWLRDAWRTGSCVPIVSAATASELVRVLAYPKFRLEPEERWDLLGEYLPFAEEFAKPRRAPRGLKCEDPKDQIFVDLALAASADALVTGDKALLALGGGAPFALLTPQGLKARLRGGNE
ncbi:MAG: putative toxin-antitoxin system toxin component, PIN family [Acidobacteriota bacterium]